MCGEVEAVRTSVDVHNFLVTTGVDHEIVLLDSDARDTEHAAAACGLSPRQMAQTHIFKADGEPVAVLARGDRIVDPDRLAQLLGARACTPVERAEAGKLTDFPKGAIPPVGLKTAMPLVLDRGFADATCVYANAGEHGAVLKMRVEDLVHRLHARLGFVTGD